MWKQANKQTNKQKTNKQTKNNPRIEREKNDSKGWNEEIKKKVYVKEKESTTKD